jgi:hypothetical protein
LAKVEIKFNRRDPNRNQLVRLRMALSFSNAAASFTAAGLSSSNLRYHSRRTPQGIAPNAVSVPVFGQ